MAERPDMVEHQDMADLQIMLHQPMPDYHPTVMDQPPPWLSHKTCTALLLSWHPHERLLAEMVEVPDSCLKPQTLTPHQTATATVSFGVSVKDV